MTINLSELLQILPDVMLLLIPGYFYWYCYNRMNATYYNAYHAVSYTHLPALWTMNTILSITMWLYLL